MIPTRNKKDINPIPRSPYLDMGFFEVDTLILIIIYSYFVDIVLPIF